MKHASPPSPPTPSPASSGYYAAETYRSEDSVGYLMKRIVGSIVGLADERLQPHGLTHAQWGPLLMLEKHGRQPVADLVRRLDVDAGAMTRLLDRLEKKGLCLRTRCTVDRRVVQVELTADGASAIREVPGVLAAVMNEHLAGFSPAEFEALKALLQRLLMNGEALRAAAPAPAPPAGPEANE